MLKSFMIGAASLGALAFVACSQGEMEEAGEAADTAHEQTTTGTTDLGQGPMEEAGEKADEAIGEAQENATDLGNQAEDAVNDAASDVEAATDGNEATKPD
jgi:hypothetical protein